MLFGTSHDQNISAVKEEMRRGLVIWEYLNGHLTIGECGEILKNRLQGISGTAVEQGNSRRCPHR